MPPPTNINVAVQLYSKRFIARLQRRIALLKAFSTNLSDEFGNPGTTIDVPILSADPAGAWDDATNNFSRSATDVNTRPVTLDQRIITGFSITMMHLAKFLPHWWEGKADLNVNAIAQAIVDPILGLITPEKTNLVFAGVEAHVCILQSALQATEAGYTVWVLTDAVASRKPEDRQTALDFLRGRGVNLIGMETFLFLLMRDANHPAFRTVQKLIK